MARSDKLVVIYAVRDKDSKWYRCKYLVQESTGFLVQLLVVLEKQRGLDRAMTCDKTFR
jgi:hypothetical protein